MNSDWIPKPPPPDQGESNRIMGIIMLILSVIIVRSEIISPLNAAAHHEKDVAISNAIVAIPFLFTIAVIATVLGKNAYRIMGHPQKPSALGWSITAVTLGLGFYLDYWMECRLSDYGYHF
jgi:small-conductance mechanosensitive channel